MKFPGCINIYEEGNQNACEASLAPKRLQVALPERSERIQERLHSPIQPGQPRTGFGAWVLGHSLELASLVLGASYPSSLGQAIKKSKQQIHIQHLTMI